MSQERRHCTLNSGLVSQTPLLFSQYYLPPEKGEFLFEEGRRKSVECCLCVLSPLRENLSTVAGGYQRLCPEPMSKGTLSHFLGAFGHPLPLLRMVQWFQWFWGLWPTDSSHLVSSEEALATADCPVVFCFVLLFFPEGTSVHHEF